MRISWIGVVLLGTVACGGAGAESSGAGGDGAGWSVGGSAEVGGMGQGGGGGSLPPLEEDPYEAPPTPPPLPGDVVDDIASDIDGILAGFGGKSHSVLVVGADTGQVIYERYPLSLLKPASNTKLFTTAAAFATLGEDHRHVTVAYATAAPQNGVIAGDLILFGDHDYTWSTQFYPTPRWPLDRLAEELAASGIQQVTGTVQARFEHLYDGYQFATYSTSAHRAAAVSAFSSALSAAGISVGGTSTSASDTLPAGAVEVGRWTSLPLHVGASPLNRISHNEFADILARHVGWVNDGDSSYGGGEAQILSLLASGSPDIDGVSFNDGSGLSHGNAVGARHIVDLLALMHARPEGLAWERSFSVAGVNGTIGGRLGGGDTYGRFRGKTGTLSDTIALSGVLDHRHDGQRYYLSMVMNGVTSASASRAAHDDIVETVAANLRGGAGLPDSPVLASVRSDGNGETAKVVFSEVAGAKGYLVWRSPDGRVWPREEARYITAHEHRTVGFEGSPTLFLRVTAVGEDGESPPSDVYVARLDTAPSRLLLVDGNDRWQAAPTGENPIALGHDFLVPYADVIEEGGVDSCDNDAVIDGACPLDGYDLVVWALGEESVEEVTFDVDEQAAVSAFASQGGALLVSGAELGWDLGQGSPADEAFLEDVLHATFVGDDAGTLHVRFDGEPVAFYTPDRMVIGYPDQLAPSADAEPFLSYLGGAGGTAGVVHRGTSPTVTLGFPFESIAAREHRAALWAAILDELTP
ncbi:MAG: D-alanyl-D-alanine carboxypeptidase [Myxococcales bacterium]|nr:D-alanyl-D-alanine carboxypeptidase [Myxococcales bacterium]